MIDKTGQKLILIIIILFIILIAGLGFIMYNSFFNDQNSINIDVSEPENSSINDNNTVKASWHSIATYSGGSSNEYENHDFNSKNGKIKVTFSGLPQKNYGDNDLQVYVVKYYNNGGAITHVGDSSISWGANDAVKSKEGTLKITSEAKKYSIQITPTNMENWSVTIWDYY